MSRRTVPRVATLLLVVGLVVSGLSAMSSAAVAPVPNSGVSSTSGWTVSKKIARLSYDRRTTALVVVPKKAKLRTTTVQSSAKGAVLRRGTTISVAGEVAATRRGVPVLVEVREVHPKTGKTLRSVAVRRTTTTTGYQWYGTSLTTRSATSRIRIAVSMRVTDRPTLRVRGFTTRLGALPSTLTPTDGPARQWVLRAAPSDARRTPIDQRIARQPSSFWALGEEAPHARLAAAIGRSQQTFTTAVVTPYYVPRRWDGLSPEAGAPTLTHYQRFTDQVADSIGSARAIVVLEPDALWFFTQVRNTIDAQGEYQQDGHWYRRADLSTRLAALRYAVERYRALPRTTVYVEAGTASGVVSAADMALSLKAVGVGRPRVGFAVNVSSYAPEPAVSTWANDVRTALRSHGVPNARYVVDTGRNGNPAWTGQATDDDPMPWCNPTGQRLGLLPGLASAAQRAEGRDWNLWVKGPGESDGDCGVGPGTVGGEFMPDVAAGMLE